MRFPKLALAVLLAVIAGPGVLRAQSTIGTISGRVSDSQGAAMPGVTVSVQSPNLQGTRTTVTTEQGDYTFPALPSGPYVVTFEIQGFERLERSARVVAGHNDTLDVVLGIAGVSELVTVTGQSADVLTRTSQVAMNLKQDLISSLPNNRDISAALLLAPSVHATGPLGAFSIGGAMSFENLFLMDGVTINENIRGQPNAVYVEDAIQETTVASGGISAEFGRFTGGVVNVITKSGGNNFSGSFRESFNNDRWRTLTPFETTTIARDPAHTDTRLDDAVPTHEYTFGGPILRNKLWFFTAGRIQTLAERRTLIHTGIPYDFKRPNRRYEVKGTYTPLANHRIQGTYITIVDNYENYTTQPQFAMDLRSLGTRKQPQDLYSVNYSGVLSQSLVVEALWARRDSSSIGAGAKSRDRIDGTLLIDQSRANGRYWSDTFCGVCSPERRDNENVTVKATYFLSNRRAGTHNMTFGYDNYNDKRTANNYQSGSDYRIFGTGAVIVGDGANQTIYPQFLNNGSTILVWQPIPVLSKGNNFRTHALFYNDSWRVNSRLTANLGVRYDRNQGRDQEGKLVVTTGAVSPRLGVVFDPTGSNKWTISANVAQFVDAVANTVADASSSAGNAQSFLYFYNGPNINANPAGPLVDTATALDQVFAWYDTARMNDTLVQAGAPNLPGVSTRIDDNLKSPKVVEYAAGISRQFDRGSLRADYMYRDWRDMYIIRTDLTTGRVTNAANQPFDLGFMENSDRLTRYYSGATFQGTYRLNRLDTGASYTLSRLWGNNDGENRNGPTASTAFQYPEYKQESWNNPEGDLSLDQRHRARFWAVYDVPWVSGLSVSGVQLVESGLPYGAVSASGVNPRPYVVPAPDYVNPPSGQNTAYYFTRRDAFRTEGQRRFDFAATYKFPLGVGARTFDLFFQGQVINVFNQMQLCACGGTVFQNGGSVDTLSIDQTVRTPVNTPSLPTFNPFTTTPVEGVNWAKGPVFGTALSRYAYTSPRQLRITFGVRF